MRDELRALYQETILDHGRQPRNFRNLPACTHTQEGFNPVCGDKLTVFLQIESGVVKDVSFQGSGCAISMASASLMTQEIKGKPVEEVQYLFDQFRMFMTQETEDNLCQKTKLKVLAGVKAFPGRVKCATLAWHTLDCALNDVGESLPVCTE